MIPKNLDKLIFIFTTAILFLGLSFLAGLYSGVKENFAIEAIRDLKGNLVLVFEERENIVPGGTPIDFLQPARHPGNGVTVNEKPDDGNLIFMSGFFDGG